MKDLKTQLIEVENYIPKLKSINLKVSNANVAWQIDHLLRVINGITKALEQSDSEQFNSSFNLWRTVFLTLNYLPRGKAKAPKKVMPVTVISEDDLIRRLSFAKENSSKLEKLPILAHFSHPMFGDLHKKQAEKFIRIHTEHHLKIIRDILRP